MVRVEVYLYKNNGRDLSMFPREKFHDRWVREAQEEVHKISSTGKDG